MTVSYAYYIKKTLPRGAKISREGPSDSVSLKENAVEP